MPLIVDVREERSVLDAVNTAVAEFGGIDICVSRNDRTRMMRFTGVNTNFYQ